jgi:hypothetical protein
MKEITSRFTIKRKDVTKYIKEHNASMSKLSARLVFTGPKISAIRFKVTPPTPRPAQRPVISIQFKKDGGGKAPGKFVAAMKNMPEGKFHVFERVPGTQMKKFKGTTRKREKLTKIMGPSAAFMVGGEAASTAIQNRSNDILTKRIEHHLKQALMK